jgi:hypothetical protein
VDMVKGYQVMAGYDNLILGSAIPGQGKDGILVGDSRLTAKRKAEEELVEDVKAGDIPCKKLRVEEGEEKDDKADDVACKKPCVGAP